MRANTSKYNRALAYKMFAARATMREVAEAIGAPIGTVTGMRYMWRINQRGELPGPTRYHKLTAPEQAVADRFWSDWAAADERRLDREDAEAAARGKTAHEVQNRRAIKRRESARRRKQHVTRTRET